MRTKLSKPGFTLIELLIVVAIIAILAAIAIPNFLLAQTRAKISKLKAGIASATTAVEAYQIDNNVYPPTRLTAGALLFEFPFECTTPIAYITSRPTDIFERYQSSPDVLPIRYTKPGWGFSASGTPTGGIYAWYANNFEDPGQGTVQIFTEDEAPIKYGIWANGPDTYQWNTNVDKQPFVKFCWYDPTNGTVSRGFIVKMQGGRTSP